MGNFNDLYLNKKFEELPFLPEHLKFKVSFYDSFQTKDLLDEWEERVRPGGLKLELKKDNRLYFIKGSQNIESNYTGEMHFTFYGSEIAPITSFEYRSPIAEIPIDFVAKIRGGILLSIELI